jgi:hypothetical protein
MEQTCPPIDRILAESARNRGKGEGSMPQRFPLQRVPDRKRMLEADRYRSEALRYGHFLVWRPRSTLASLHLITDELRNPSGPNAI